jgi:hypothetical protein
MHSQYMRLELADCLLHISSIAIKALTVRSLVYRVNPIRCATLEFPVISGGVAGSLITTVHLLGSLV